MTRTIWKFEFDITDNLTIDMPSGAVILDVQNQKGVACIWAIVNPDSVKLPRKINVVGTGHPMAGRSMGNYIGTVQFYGGDLVFHVFDGGEE